jgi:Na+/H+ antiporter NhaD/arsenite permease-like protein
VEKIISIAVAILAYILIIIFSSKKSYISILFALLLILLKILTFREVIYNYINWNVLLIYISTLILAELFIYSKMPSYLADRMVKRAGSSALAMLYICILTGFISAFVENVATVLVIAPIAFEICKRLKISPVNLLIAIAISSNLQGTATLVGDPPSMIFAAFLKLNFNDFFIYKSKPSIFFAVQIGAISSLFFLYFLFKNLRKKIKITKKEKIISFVPTYLLILMIISLAFISFFDKGFTIKNGIACAIIAIIGILWFIIFEKKDKKELIEIGKKLDYDTIIFLIGIFIIMGAISKTGVLIDFANFIKSIIGNNPLIAYIIIIFFSVIISGFVDNVPFIIVMLPVVDKIGKDMGINPELLMFGMLIGTCLGGNITPFGASANIVSVGLLKQKNYKVDFLEFVKIGLPFTLVATSMSGLFVWLIWSR